MPGHTAAAQTQNMSRRAYCLSLLHRAAGVASFHGSPLMRNGSLFKPGTNVSVAIFNGYNDASPGANAKAKADVQARTQHHMQQNVICDVFR